jgi:hypothetical protein
VWEFNATTKSWTGLSKAVGAKFSLPGTKHPQLQDKDTFDDVTGQLKHKRKDKPDLVIEAKQLGLSPRQADYRPPPPAAPPQAKPAAKSPQEQRNAAAEAAAKKEAERKEAAKIPNNAAEALNHYLKQNRDVLHRGMRTLCAMFVKEKSDYVTGRSGGPNTKIWERQGVQVTFKATVPAADRVKLTFFAKHLTDVKLDRTLGREVWDCAEVDAAVNAILKKRWTQVSKFTFRCAEWPGAESRFIDACAHCRQWSER